MSVAHRNNVRVQGAGPAMIFAHGFGCNQAMWRLLTPRFAERFRVITFDLVGSGQSDLRAYDATKYASLNGYASDLVEIIDEFAGGPALFVGHSVSAMIGVLADLQRPGRFAGHLMVAPSPCYVNDGEYVGGFARADIDGLLNMLESNYLGWSSSMAPSIMGSPSQPELAHELETSFCRNDPEIAKQFARVTFLSDCRKELALLSTPSLIIQSAEDFIAPVCVGEYIHDLLPNSMLRVVDNVGHCPHLSAPGASADAMDDFLASLGY